MARNNCCCTRGTNSATCICAVIVFHIMLIIALISALFTRFNVYQDLSMEDMPSDMRVLSRVPHTIFCSQHEVRTYLKDSVTGNRATKQQILESNVLPDFDAYMLDYDPRLRSKKGALIGPKLYTFGGVSALDEGEYQYHPFKFRANSSIDITICSWKVKEHLLPDISSVDLNNYKALGLVLFFVKGENTFDTLTSDIANDRNTIPDCKNDSRYHGNCLKSMNITPGPSRFCEPGEGLPPHNPNMTSPVADEGEYYVIIFNPSSMLKSDPGAQKFRVLFSVNRTEFNLTGVKPTEQKTSKLNSNRDQFLVVHFNYTLNDTTNYLYNIELEYLCQPKVLVYLGVFFFLPLLLLIIMAVGVLCCRPTDPGYQYSVNVEPAPDHNNDESNQYQYGSTEAIYR